MGTNYKHLGCEERTMIQLSLEQGCTLRAIARSVQRGRGENTSGLLRQYFFSLYFGLETAFVLCGAATQKIYMNVIFITVDMSARFLYSYHRISRSGEGSASI
jgi:hypothetical protein